MNRKVFLSSIIRNFIHGISYDGTSFSVGKYFLIRSTVKAIKALQMLRQPEFNKPR